MHKREGEEFFMSTKKLCVNALLIALVCVLTMAVQVPVPATEGYIHLGDAAILVSAVFFGPEYGLIAGGLGSGLADLLSGYPHWVIPTLIIKSVMGFAVGHIAKYRVNHSKFLCFNTFLASFVGIVIMVFGYFVAGAIMKGSLIVSLASVPSNIVQGVSGMVIFGVVGTAFHSGKIYRLINKFQ